MRILLLIFSTCFAIQVFAKEVEFTLRSIDATLAKIAPHAQNYPPKFESVEERKQLELELLRLLYILDSAIVKFPNDADLLLRDAIGNSMGHNLDFDGCDLKCISAFEKFLKFKPDDKMANYHYGAFLAGTATRQKDSIKYLKKAVSLGVTDAHYTLAFAYLGQADKKNALLHLRKYAEANPDEKWIKEKIAEVEKAEIRIKKGPSPEKN